MGALHQAYDDLDDAQQQYREALSIWWVLGDRLGEARTLYQMGTIYQDQGNREKASLLYGTSLTIAEEICELEGIARLVYELSVLWQDKENYPSAAKYLARALPLRTWGTGGGRRIMSFGRASKEKIEDVYGA